MHKPAHFQVLLQASEKLSVHLPALSKPESLPLCLLQAVLKDPAVLVGSLKLPAHVLQLASIFLVEGVPHLIHLCPHLLDFSLATTSGASIGRTSLLDEQLIKRYSVTFSEQVEMYHLHRLPCVQG